MWFYKQVRVPSMLAASETELKVRFGSLIVWLVGILVLVALAIYAHRTNWDAGATAIFSLASAIAGVGIGRLTGEQSGAKSAQR